MTAHEHTNRVVGLPAEAVICRRSESWPIDRTLSLQALFHMGLTVEQVARYFSIDPVEVQALLSGH